MKLLKVGSEVVDALGVQELPDHIRRLQLSNGGHILSHGAVVVMLAVQVVSVAPLDLSTAARVCLHRTTHSCKSQVVEKACYVSIGFPIGTCSTLGWYSGVLACSRVRLIKSLPRPETAPYDVSSPMEGDNIGKLS